MGVTQTINDAAGIIRGKEHGKAGEHWRGKSKKKNPSRKGKPGKTPSMSYGDWCVLPLRTSGWLTPRH